MSAEKRKNKSLKQKTVTKKEVNQKSKLNVWLFISGILALTFIVFFPSINNQLTNWDDPSYLNENPLIRSLNWNNIKRIFSEVYLGNYQPLHIFSYAVEYQFYKLNPSGYHTTSVIMHLIVTFLVFKFLLLLTKNFNISIISTLLFGIHPLHIESVAWAAERKDLLYAIFFLLSLIYYIKYIESNGKFRFIIFAFLLFTLSIFSKAMASSLPPVLILLDFYYNRKLNLKLVLEKIPFFALAITMGLVAAFTASSTGQVSVNVFNLFERILIANFNLLAYVVKLIIPFNLSAFYPYPPRVNGHLPYYFYIAPFIIVGLLFLIIRSVKKTKIIILGAGFFVACIFLVLQLLPVGPTMISERYTYLPSIGFFLVLSFFIQKIITKEKSFTTIMYAGIAIYSIFLCNITFKRCDVWKDSFTLWDNVLQQFPNASIALNNRGNIYGKEKGDLKSALADFNKSIFYDSAYPNAYTNRGIVYCMQGKITDGIADFNNAIKYKPDFFDAILNRGIAYLQTKQFDKSLTDFNTLSKKHFDDARVYMFRGATYNEMGKYDFAYKDMNTAISLNPLYGEAYYQRSNTLANMHKNKEAFDDVRYAIKLGFNVKPEYFERLKNAAGNK